MNNSTETLGEICSQFATAASGIAKRVNEALQAFADAARVAMREIAATWQRVTFVVKWNAYKAGYVRPMPRELRAVYVAAKWRRLYGAANSGD